MQLYALDKSSLVSASGAGREICYLCPECRGMVKKRGGPRRQAHFYHLRRPASCRQHGKSLAHLQIQLHLKSLIPSLALEKRVENRIADTLWEQEKIVFEVQCSPLSLAEARHRCRDYAALGYTPVWILHDKRFNRSRLSPAEEYLRLESTAYFTNGRHIYDQFDVCKNSRRLFTGPPLPVDMSVPLKKTLPPLFSRKWSLSFQGDLHSLAETQDLSHLESLQNEYLQQTSVVKHFYKFLLYRFLEMTSL
jgi:competence protein CoiA